MKIVSKENEHTYSVVNMGNIFGEMVIYEEEGNDKIEEKAVILEDSVVCVIDYNAKEIIITQL